MMMRAPTLEWSMEAVQAVQKLADENESPYLDLNLYREETGIDWTTDTPDKGEHLNVLGCKKASSFFGEYLKDNYEFDTKLSGKNRRFWDESAEEYHAVIEAYRLKEQKKQ